MPATAKLLRPVLVWWSHFEHSARLRTTKARNVKGVDEVVDDSERKLAIGQPSSYYVRVDRRLDSMVLPS